MKSILVIGESCRDVFIYCTTDRLCPDVPVPVLNILDQIDNGGMAKNVQLNIQSLSAKCHIVTNPDWFNITKTRYVHKQSNHTFFRVDTPHLIERVDVSKISLNYDIVVISDYNKGFLHEEDIEFICSKHDNVFLDTKKILGKWAQKANFIKINDYEYQNSIHNIDGNLASKIIHTQGAKGATYRNKTYSVDSVAVKDSSGAGDTFMAGLVVKYAATGDIAQSIEFANQCASEVVKRVGVSII